jgi:hypothetical protein
MFKKSIRRIEALWKKEICKDANHSNRDKEADNRNVPPENRAQNFSGRPVAAAIDST